MENLFQQICNSIITPACDSSLKAWAKMVQSVGFFILLIMCFGRCTGVAPVSDRLETLINGQSSKWLTERPRPNIGQSQNWQSDLCLARFGRKDEIEHGAWCGGEHEPRSELSLSRTTAGNTQHFRNDVSRLKGDIALVDCPTGTRWYLGTKSELAQPEPEPSFHELASIVTQRGPSFSVQEEDHSSLHPTLPTHNLIDRLGIVSPHALEEGQQQAGFDFCSINSRHSSEPYSNGMISDLEHWTGEAGAPEAPCSQDDRKRKHPQAANPHVLPVLRVQMGPDLIHFLDSASSETVPKLQKERQKIGNLRESLALRRSSPDPAPSFFCDRHRAMLPTLFDSPLSSETRHPGPPSCCGPEFGPSSIPRTALQSYVKGQRDHRPVGLGDAKALDVFAEGPRQTGGDETFDKAFARNPSPSAVPNAMHESVDVGPKSVLCWGMGQSPIDKDFRLLQENISKRIVANYLSLRFNLLENHPPAKDISTFITTMNEKLENVLEQSRRQRRAPTGPTIRPIKLSTNHWVFRLIQFYRSKLRPTYLNFNGYGVQEEYQRSRHLNEIVYQNSIRTCVKYGLERMLQGFLSKLFARIYSSPFHNTNLQRSTRAGRTILVIQGIVLRFLYHIILLHQLARFNFSEVAVLCKKRADDALQLLIEFWMCIDFGKGTSRVPTTNIFWKAQNHRNLKELVSFRNVHGVLKSENSICQALLIQYFQEKENQFECFDVNYGPGSHLTSFLHDIAIIDWLADFKRMQPERPHPKRLRRADCG